MADKSLAYFMRDTSKTIKEVTIPGVESIKDDKGNIIDLKVKILTQKQIEDIYDKYRTRSIVKDKKGNPLVNRGQVVVDVQTDSNTALRRILVEAITYPNMKDKELMAFYDCHNYADMPTLVFPDPKEYQQVQNSVLGVLGILDVEDESSEDEIEDAKN